MDKMQQKINKIKEDLTFSMLKIKEDVENYLNIHLLKHEEGLDDNCSKRIKRSTDQAENLSSSLEEAVNELQEEMASNWEGSEDEYIDTTTRQMEELSIYQEKLQMIVWGSWEALDTKTKPNKCKQCNFLVEGKIKPSKVKQKLEAHFNSNHQVYYSNYEEENNITRNSVLHDEVETTDMEVDNKCGEDRAKKQKIAINSFNQDQESEYDEDYGRFHRDYWNETDYESGEEDYWTDSDDEFGDKSMHDSNYEEENDIVPVLHDEVETADMEQANNIGISALHYEVETANMETNKYPVIDLAEQVTPDLAISNHTAGMVACEPINTDTGRGSDVSMTAVSAAHQVTHIELMISMAAYQATFTSRVIWRSPNHDS